MNPSAVVFWAILGITGYLLNGQSGALIGILIGLILSFIVDIYCR